MRLIIITIPLITAIIIYILGRKIGEKGSKRISIGSILGSTIISIWISIEYIIQEKIYKIIIKEWIDIGIYKTNIELRYDKESLIMLNLICIITLIIIIYSYWYIIEERNKNKFISNILIFSVAMMILVLSNNIILTFIGWEGVGIVSYLLINYWNTNIQNNKSAIKALIYNKVGDICYIIAITLCVIIYNSTTINQLTNNILVTNTDYNLYIYILFLIASMAKSAQIFLHPWLGDAMAGPTPVSALLHSATMVTAGIYLLRRLNIENIMYMDINWNINELIQGITILTIIFAGLSSIYQYDIKKIIAYSTCAQLGYMFYSLCILTPNNASLFHLTSHGFFKSLLFICSGIIIHSLSNEQDIRKFGNLLFKSPTLFLFVFIGSLSLIAIPTLSGYYSKDIIILHSLSFNTNLSSYIYLYLGSILSTIYSFNLLYYTFINNSTILFSSIHINMSKFYYLIILILFSIIFGYLFINIVIPFNTINFNIEYLTHNNLFIKLSLIIIPIFGILFVYHNYFHNNIIFSYNLPLYIHNLFNRRLFYDTIYHYLLLFPLFSSSYHIFYKSIDRGFLEYFGPLGFFRLFLYIPYSMDNILSNNTTPYLSKLSLGKISSVDSGNYTLLNKQNISNQPYILYYILFSILLFICYFMSVALPQSA